MTTRTLSSWFTRHLAGHHSTKHSMSARARIALQLIAKIRHGAVKLVLPNGEQMQVGDASAPVTLTLRDWSLLENALHSGDIGAAESFIRGSWDCDDLPRLLEIMTRNRAMVAELLHGSGWRRVLYRLTHSLRRNSRRGSQRNIHAHYDLGNDFYRLWLDEGMTYSSALFKNADDTLLQAQTEKYRRVLKQLNTAPDAHILEIGCGWGGFAEYAAQHGAQVTGLTLSHAQLDFAQQRMVQHGLDARVVLRLQDYRDCNEQYDAIASIEMFEAVGEAYWDEYFACLRRNLKPGGRACIQSIVIADELFDDYRRSTDFIQQYIFPGGMLPSVAVFHQLAQKHGFMVTDTFTFGADYARTLEAWRTKFLQQRAAVYAQGFDTRFLRAWDFYLAYCIGGFRADSINVAQFTLER